MQNGPQRVSIVSHSTGNVNGKFVVRIRVLTKDGEAAEVTIFCTEKSMGMARASLKVCGFDIDTHPVQALDVSPPMLGGNEIPIIVEDYNGKPRCSIDLNQRAEKSACDAITAALRAVKKQNQNQPPGQGEAVEDYGNIPF